MFKLAYQGMRTRVYGMIEGLDAVVPHVRICVWAPGNWRSYHVNVVMESS
jgi:hypothetical protein